MKRYIALAASLLVLGLGFYYNSLLVIIVSLFFVGHSLASLWNGDEKKENS